MHTMLPADASDQEEDDEPQPLLPPPRRPAGYNAVGFDYGQTAPAAAGAADLSAEAAATAAQARPQQQPPGEQGADKPFVPTFLVPHHLREHLPSLERMHKVRDAAAGTLHKIRAACHFIIRVTTTPFIWCSSRGCRYRSSLDLGPVLHFGHMGLQQL